MGLALNQEMSASSGPRGRNQRRAPRVDVLMRVEGVLVSIDAHIIVHDLSRSGFAIMSQRSFDPGQTLDFRLTAIDGPTVAVTAESVHTRSMPGMPGMHLSGFRFVPGRLTGLVPQALIDQLIETINPVASTF